MALIKNRVLADDTWVHVADETPVPAEEGAIVSRARWEAERDTLGARNAPIGVRLDAGDGPEILAGDIGRLDLIAVPFDHFKDGRGYSTARLLRERHGFTGELRAVGNVLRDQLAFLERCGFDAFEYAGKQDAEKAIAAFNEIGAVYQTAADRRLSAAALRNHPSKAFANGTSG